MSIKNKKRVSSVSNNSFKKYLSYFKSVFSFHKRFVYIFLFFLFLGFLSAFFLPNFIKLQLFDQISLLVESVYNSNSLVLLFNVFFNNFYVAILLFLLGLTFIIPFIMIFFNGLVIGLMFDLGFKLVSLNWFVPFQMLLAIFPHGIFEIPALLLAPSLSIVLFIKLFFRKRFFPKLSFSELFRSSIKSFFGVVAVLLIIAAIIEVFVTFNISSFSLSSSLFTDDKSLSDNLLQKSNLQDLGFADVKELDVDLFMKQSDSLLNNARIRFLSTIYLVYDDSLFNKFKSFENSPDYTSIFSFSNNNLENKKVNKNLNFVLLQQVTSFDSEQTALDYLDFLQEVNEHINISGLQKSKLSNNINNDLNNPDNNTLNSITVFNYHNFTFYQTSFIKQRNNNFLLYTVKLETDNSPLNSEVNSVINGLAGSY